MDFSFFVIIVIAISVILFIGIMCYFFDKYQAVPDSLIVMVGSIVVGEFGILGFIKNGKTKKEQTEISMQYQQMIQYDDTQGGEE